MPKKSRVLALIFDFVKFCDIMTLLQCFARSFFSWDFVLFLRRWRMGKKKDKRKAPEKEIQTFEDAMRLIFSNTVPKGCPDAIVVELVPEEVDYEPEESPSELEATRQEIFDMMTETEIAAYDLLDNFVNTPKAGLPEESDSLEAKIEHADWNTDENRLDVASELAELEAEIAYYAYIRQVLPDEDDYLEACLADIQDSIDEIVRDARAIELSTRLEFLDYEIDQATQAMNDASVRIDEAVLERDIIFDQLEALNTELYD